MAGRRLALDTKIERLEGKMLKAKEKYDLYADEMKHLLEKRDEANRRKLLEAFEDSDRTYDEVMEFLNGKDR